jgi:uncharacterized lipoprotein YddW (UPF0748 family)
MGISKEFAIMKSALAIFCFFVIMIGAVINWSYADHSSQVGDPEIRALWVVPRLQFEAVPEIGKKQIRAFVKKIGDANFNILLVEMPSDYMAAKTDERYQKDIPVAKWDAIGELIKMSHEAGLQVHLWYSFTDYKSPRSPEFNPIHKGDPQWAAVQIGERTTERTPNRDLPRRMSVLCPVHPEARRWELGLLEQAIQRYPLLSGIHIEEPGYSGQGECVCDLCLKLFQEIYGINGLPDVNSPQAEDLRCLGTTDFIRSLRILIKSLNPEMVMSVNGGFSWQTDRRLGRNWKQWAELKWLDFYTPQIYTTDVNKFRNNVQNTVSALGNDCPVIPGIALKWGPEERNVNSLETVLREIELARQVGAKGVVIYKDEFLTGEYLDALKSGPFKEKVPVPKFRR